MENNKVNPIGLKYGWRGRKGGIYLTYIKWLFFLWVYALLNPFIKFGNYQFK